MSDIQAWVCGQRRGKDRKGNAAWDFQGVFSTRDRAVNACRGPNWFVAPVYIDEVVPSEKIDWPGLEYPLNEAK